MIVFSALNRSHNKFLQTPLYESNCFKQITKLLIRRSRKEENDTLWPPLTKGKARKEKKKRRK